MRLVISRISGIATYTEVIYDTYACHRGYISYARLYARHTRDAMAVTLEVDVLCAISGMSVPIFGKYLSKMYRAMLTLYAGGSSTKSKCQRILLHIN